MDDCGIQKTETVSSCYKYDDVGILILEELRTFRKEMKDEVRKLQENVQNFLFSKADIVNALLENSFVLNEVDKLTETSSADKCSDSCMELKSQLNKTSNGKRKKVIKFQPTTIEVLKPVQVSNDAITTTSPVTEILSNSDGNSNTLPVPVSHCSNAKMVKIMNDFRANDDIEDSHTAQHHMEVQVLQCNGDSVGYQYENVKSSSNKIKLKRFIESKSNDDGHIANSKLQANSGKIIPFRKMNIKHRSSSGLSLLTSSQNAVILPVHSAPKLPSKFNNYIGRLKIDKSVHTGSSLQKYTSRDRRPCHFCGRIYASSSDLKRHIRIHTGDRPFRCELCPKAYTRNDHLQRHIKQKHFCDSGTIDSMTNENIEDAS